MIKNLVFDYGQVLIHFEPEQIVADYVKDRTAAELLCRVVFDPIYWNRKLDSGLLDNEQAKAEFKSQLPKELHRWVDVLMDNWPWHTPPMEGMEELIRCAKKTYGVRVFLLSNISSYFADHADRIPVLRLMDGCVFSGKCKLLKPQREIYEHLCSKFSLIPDETLFVDDKESNIRAAEEYGIHGYVFDGDSVRLKDYLQKVLSGAEK